LLPARCERQNEKTCRRTTVTTAIGTTSAPCSNSNLAMFTKARPIVHGWSATRPGPLIATMWDVLHKLLTGALKITYLWVALGGSARYALSGIVVNWFGVTFPWGTLIVNITGCFVIGIFNALTEPEGPLRVPSNIRIFVMVGMCGGYTTFSSFSLEFLNLMRIGDWLRAVAYILASVIFCLVGVSLGHVTGLLLHC
jgi:fluoride exporter